LLLYTDDFDRDFVAYQNKGVVFVRPPHQMPYGRVAVFRDIYGNLWDLLEPEEDVRIEGDIPIYGRVLVLQRREKRDVPQNPQKSSDISPVAPARKHRQSDQLSMCQSWDDRKRFKLRCLCAVRSRSETLRCSIRKFG
jgi:hypothetical protein